MSGPVLFSMLKNYLRLVCPEFDVQNRSVWYTYQIYSLGNYTFKPLSTPNSSFQNSQLVFHLSKPLCLTGTTSGERIPISRGVARFYPRFQGTNQKRH